MEWKEFLVHTINEAVEPISNILNEAGANGVVIQDPLDLEREYRNKFGEIYELDPNNYPRSGIIIKAYFPVNEAIPEKINSLKHKINGLRDYQIDIGNPTFLLNDVADSDWENEWKKYFKPIQVTDRFTIVPVWERYEKSSDEELIITIDPGMAFGTGTHPTTILSLQALEETLVPGDKVIDVGSGSGILSIGSVLLGASTVYAFDLDEVAISSTKENVALSNFSSKVTVEQNDLLKNVKLQANIVVSNILADILVSLVADAWDNLLPGGYFITSGIIESKQGLVEDKLAEVGFQIEKVNTLDKWLSIIARKPK